MVLVKAMGLMDFLAGINLFMLHFGVYDWHIGMYFFVYLLFKGIAFYSNWATMVDMAVSFYMVFLFLGMGNIVITFIAFAWLMQKVHPVFT